MSFTEINNEIETKLAQGDLQAVDTIRREKLKKVSEITERPTLLYAVEMSNLDKIKAAKGATAIQLDDKDGFRETVEDIDGDTLDIVIQSPGGSPEATESLVKMLRNRFSSIRFIIPSIAKSAATMFSMSGNEIILGDDAELGPTDPQMVTSGKAYPAHAVLEQFSTAKKEISESSNVLPAWLPILEQYGPSLLQECNNAINLTTVLVKEWLAKYMFEGESSPVRRAGHVSKYLAGNKHLSHNRSIDIDYLIEKGVNIKYSSAIGEDFNKAIIELHHAVNQTFARTGAYKLFENSAGKGIYRVMQVVVVQGRQPASTP